MYRISKRHRARKWVASNTIHDISAHEKPHNIHWHYASLRRWPLLALAFSSAVLCALLVLLYLNSDPRNGLRSLMTSQFVWTYGPTAMLVIWVAFWRQIDMHLKSLAPWHEMTTCCPRASKSVLLDYISPLQISSFTMSIRNKHIHVTLGIIAFTTAKLVTLASTALFVLVPTPVNVSASGTVQTGMFNGSLTTVDQFPTLNDSSLVYTTITEMTIISEANSSLQRLAAESCFGPESSKGQLLRANLTVVAPEVNCTRVAVELILDPSTTDEQHPEFNLRMPPNGCRVADNRTGIPAYALNPAKFLCPPRQLSPLVQPIICNDTETNWQLITLTEFRYAQKVEGDITSMTNGDPISAIAATTVVNRTTSIACRMSYSMYDGMVVCGPDVSANRTVVSSLSPRPGKLDGLTDNDLSRLFRGALSAASDAFGNVLDDSYSEEYPDTLVTLMARQDGLGYESLFEGDSMEAAASVVSESITSRILTSHFLQVGNTPIDGELSGLEDRLYVNTTAIWIMFTGLAVCGGVALLLALMQLVPPIPSNPEHVSSSALILSQGPEARTTFRSHGSPNFFETLQHFRFSIDQSVFNPGGQRQFRMLVHGPNDLDAPDKQESQPQWWHPVVLRFWAQISAIGAILLCIGGLELLWYFSYRQGGFPTSTLRAGDLVDLDLRNIFPLIALLIATSINALDFNIAVLAPFQAAQYRWINPVAGLAPVIGKAPPHALYSLLKAQNWGPFLSGMSALLASVLTIVASGLYANEVRTGEATKSTSALVMDTFDPSWPNSVLDDGDAAVVASVFENGEGVYPPTVHEDLALPGISLSQAGASFLQLAENDTLTVLTSAMRASVVCETVPRGEYNVTGAENPRLGATITVEGSVSLPDGCLIGGPGGNSSFLDFTHATKLSRGANSTSIGKLLNVHLGGFDGTTQQPVDELDPTRQQDNPTGCPSLLFIYGFVDLAVTSQDFTGNTTLLLCSQHLDTVSTQVHYSHSTLTGQPSLVLSPHDAPPSPISSLPSTPIPASTSNTSILSFPFRPQLNLDRRLAMYSQTKYDSRNSGSSPVDPFFQAVIFGRHPVPESFLASRIPSEQLAVQRSIQGVYRRYMAHVIDAKMRRPISPTPTSNATGDAPSTTTATTIPATLTSRPQQLRLVQSRTSTTILQVLLAIIAALMIAALSLTQTREVVSYNPCCFAGVAALWAGSRFVKDVSPRMLFMGEKAMKDELQNWEIRLGWWDGDGKLLGDGDREGGGKEVPRKGRWGMEGRVKVL